MNNWQSIETAPKDWQTIILYSSETGEVFAGYYAPKDGGSDRWEAHYIQDEMSPENPTHWMPLPPPPNAKAQPRAGDKPAASSAL
jgi:Protein of unknown function (DUF551)